MSDKVAWGVFKGLFGFFVLLPLCVFLVLAFLAIFVGFGDAVMNQYQESKQSKQKAELVPPNQVAPVIGDIDKRKEAERLAKEQAEQQALAQQAEAARLQKEALTEKLFSTRRQQALQGSSTACYDLGLMYLNGEGTQTNVELGLKYIKIAADGGYGLATKFLKRYKP
jgi:TPR repeat protein